MQDRTEREGKEFKKPKCEKEEISGQEWEEKKEG